MRFHLKDRHPLLFQGLSNDTSGSSSNSSNPCGSASALPGQQRLPEMFRQQEPFSRSLSKWSMSRFVIFWLKIPSLLMLSMVPDFKNLFMTWSLDISLLTGKLYLLHTCRAFTEVSKWQCIHEELQNTCKKISFTTDMWTSRATHTYVSFTLHYINEQYELKHYLLETKEFTEAHTANNIAEEMRNILSEWELDTMDLVAATTDNATNIN